MPEKPPQRKPIWVTRFRLEMGIKWNLTPEQLERAKKDYAGLTQREFMEKNLLPEAAELNGPNGERAFVRNGSNDYEKNKYILVMEIPLFLPASQKREATKQASNFFERLYISDYEKVPRGGKFTRITRRPYEQTTMRMGDPDKKPMPEYDVRTVWYHKLKKPYGSGTTQRTVIERRDNWIRRRYKTLLSKYSHQYKSVRICMMIQEELLKSPPDKFGKWSTKKRNPLLLSIDNIRRIANTLPKPAR